MFEVSQGQILEVSCVLWERWTSKKVSLLHVENLQYRAVTDIDEWKLIMTKELLDVMNGDTEVEGFDWMELKDIFHSLCVS